MNQSTKEKNTELSVCTWLKEAEQRLLVTGATGFIGRRFVEVMRERQIKLRLLVRQSSIVPSLFAEDIELVAGDIEDETSLLRAMEGVDIVYHIAGCVDYGPLEKLLKINCDGTRNVCSACVRAGVRRLVHISSTDVIAGNLASPIIDTLPYAPLGHYGCSKAEGEKVVLNFKDRLDSVILRPCHVFGLGDPLLRLFMQLLQNRYFPILGKGDALWHMVYIDNLVSIMILSSDPQRSLSGRYTIGDASALSAREIFSIIAEEMGRPPPYHVPDFFIRPLWLLFSKAPNACASINRKLDFFFRDRVFDVDRSYDEIGFAPRINTNEALRTTIRAILRSNASC